MADESQSLAGALELISQHASNDPELAGALRTVLEGMLAKLPEPALEPVLLPEIGPAWDEPELLEEPVEEQPAYAEWPDLGSVTANLFLKAQAFALGRPSRLHRGARRSGHTLCAA